MALAAFNSYFLARIWILSDAALENVFSPSNILNSLSQAYGQMILKSGFFHADPHPGNILISKGSEASHLLCVVIP